MSETVNFSQAFARDIKDDFPSFCAIFLFTILAAVVFVERSVLLLRAGTWLKGAQPAS